MTSSGFACSRGSACTRSRPPSSLRCRHLIIPASKIETVGVSGFRTEGSFCSLGGLEVRVLKMEGHGRLLHVHKVASAPVHSHEPHVNPL